MHVWHVCYIPHFHPYNTDQAGLTELCWANHTSFNCYAWVCTFLNNIHSFIGECTTCSPVTFSYKKLYVYTTLPVCACVLSLQNSFCCMVVLCVLLYILWACSIKNIWVLHIDEFVILFNTLHCSVIHWKRFFTQKALQEVAIDLMQFHQFFVSSFPPFLSQSFPFFLIEECLQLCCTCSTRLSWTMSGWGTIRCCWRAVLLMYRCCGHWSCKCWWRRFGHRLCWHLSPHITDVPYNLWLDGIITGPK